ncbi:cytochrome c biogenesis protein DipZ [Candidatus Amesbacteria bacterium]|nr:cytochrome c biogenesis protein DipZ [Candidatus Amesbacteria bacterium]
MILLIIFAFLAGIITILSPCILPILPIILSSAVSKTKPIGIIVGFVASFTFFTLFLSTIVRTTGIPADYLRIFSIIIIFVFGISQLVPKYQEFVESLFSNFTKYIPQNNSSGFLIGMSLGLLWTPCVGPILASVISLAIAGTVTLDAFILTLAYSVGTAIPMFVIMSGGQRFIPRSPWIQKAFGVIMIITAIGIYFGIDRQFQTFILNKFPNYGTNLTKFEDKAIKKQLPKLGNASEIIAGGQWFGSTPLTIAGLKGKVILIDFWTYTCINCQRTLPYVQKWWTKYKDRGLVIIGVHSPEFEFEKNPNNVAKAIKDFGLTYPVVQDNDFATWQAYDNQYWPAKYLIDRDGTIRYTHFGEGKYDETEKIIQELLGTTAEISNSKSQNFARTPETYLGSARNPFKSGFTLTGNWQITKEYATAPDGGVLEMNFDAANVYLVMRPSNKPALIKIYLDGRPYNEFFVDSDKLYDIISIKDPGRHILKLEFDANKPQLYAFTFG